MIFLPMQEAPRDPKQIQCTVPSKLTCLNPSQANDEYKRKNLFEYPGHIIHAVSVHYAQQRAGAVINFILYFFSTRWQYSSTFIMIYRDFFVHILQDAVLPAISIQASFRFLRDEEIDSLLECDDENLSEFLFGESDSDIQQDSVSAKSDSNSDTSDTDGSFVTVDPVAAVASEWRSVSDSDPAPSNINTVNND
jgi:hypothetical protein